MSEPEVLAIIFCINPSLILFLCQGMGTDEDTLIEVMASRNNTEMLEIKKAYKEGVCQHILNDNLQFHQVIDWTIEYYTLV